MGCLHPLSEWLSSKRQEVGSLGKFVEKKETHVHFLVGMYIAVSTLENNMEVLQRIKNRATMLYDNPISEFYTQRK